MPISRRRFLAASAAVPLFAPSLALAQAKEFRLGLITPNGHSWNKAALKLGDDLKAATNGRLTMTVFHSGKLGGLDEAHVERAAYRRDQCALHRTLDVVERTM